MNKTLIIKGVNSTDELKRLGISVAEKYAEASHVIFIDKRGNCRTVKGSETNASLIGLQFIDAQEAAP